MYANIAANKRNSIFLILGFIVVVSAIGYIFSRALDSPGLLIAALVFSIGYSFISYYYSASMVLAASRAQEVDRSSAPELYRVVENLSITAGLPMPRVYIIDDAAPNAFATGRDPEHAVVVATSGILAMLDKSELEGVIAHELSHVGNYDIRMMSLIAVMVTVIVLASDWFARLSFWGGGRRRSNDGDSQGVFMIVALVLAILAPIVGTLIQLAVSRQREYLADASGALLTRYPEGLAQALAKISADPRPLSEANKATANLYIVNPFRENVTGGGGWVANLFSTHPPINERIKRLEAMEGNR